MASNVQFPCDEAVIQTGPEAQPCAKRQKTWVLVATILGSSMAFIDGTVVNVALPFIQAQFNATVSEFQWVVESYALFLAALILLGGSLGDHFGRKRIFGIGIAVFTIASIACGLAQDVTQLILARALQGIGGALLVPGSLAIISATFPESERGKAIGTWSAFTAITTAIGPVLGGWLVETLSWRWIFYMNVPITIAVVAILITYVPESRDPDARALDPIGAVLVTLGLGGVIYGLIESNTHSFGHPLVLGALVLGVISLIGFVISQRRISEPMLPLAIFESKTFTGANILTLLLYAGLGGALFFFPFNLLQVQGYSATAAGAAMLPLIAILFLMSRWSGGLVDRFGSKLPLIIGPLIAAAGFALMAVPGIGGPYWTTYFPAIVVLGLGMAISVAPLTTTVMNAVSERRAGLASGINNAVSRAAGLIAIAVMGIVVTLVFNQQLDTQLASLEAADGVIAEINAQRDQLAGITVPDSASSEMTENLDSAIDWSFIAAFRIAMLIAALLAVLSALSALLLIEGKRRD